MNDIADDHRRRSEFIRRLVQRRLGYQEKIDHQLRQPIPRVIVQFWHDVNELPSDIEECISSWSRWQVNGFVHRLFDQRAASRFISLHFGERYLRAFHLCYHPAMQADYFRLCYLLAEGGCYVDADDICISESIDWLFSDGRLKVQPLCYDISTSSMVSPAHFLRHDANSPGWIFYCNNNPLIGRPRHPIIGYALNQATSLLEIAGHDGLPEIQSTTGPGNLSRSIFELGAASVETCNDLVILSDWDSMAVSKWPLSHRNDARNWRLSNQKRFFSEPE